MIQEYLYCTFCKEPHNALHRPIYLCSYHRFVFKTALKQPANKCPVASQNSDSRNIFNENWDHLSGCSCEIVGCCRKVEGAGPRRGVLCAGQEEQPASAKASVCEAGGLKSDGLNGSQGCCLRTGRVQEELSCSVPPTLGREVWGPVSC